jgi:hypothetical protein
MRGALGTARFSDVVKAACLACQSDLHDGRFDGHFDQREHLREIVRPDVSRQLLGIRPLGLEEQLVLVLHALVQAREHAFMGVPGSADDGVERARDFTRVPRGGG